MTKLIVYPTLECPFKCYFCYNSNNDDRTLLDINVLDEFLQTYSKKFDSISISGGEPSFLLNEYVKDLTDVIRKYFNEFEVQTYPIKLIKHQDGMKYNFAYDVLARPRVNEAWVNMLKFDKEFDLTITLSPLLYKFHPNKILHNLTLLKNLKTVFINPYFKNEHSKFDISHSEYNKFINIIKNSELRVPFKIEFFDLDEDQYIFTPSGKLMGVEFDNNIRREVEIKPSQIGKFKTEYPSNVRI
jgi:organic radical activating enzyme